MDKYDHGGDVYGKANISLDFSVNVNPLGLPANVKEALISGMDDFINYPDPKTRDLIAAISLHEKVPADWILCGNGAADLIYRICYGLKPKRALICGPSFSEYERALRQLGAEIIIHELKEEDNFDLTDGFLEEVAAGPDIIFLCNPNNPTGRLASPDLLEEIIFTAAKQNTRLVVDECFLEFTKGDSTKKYLSHKPNLVVLKAFTKMYAMAGLRLGYIMASDRDLLDKVNRAGQIWSVSLPAQIAGVAALKSPGWVEKSRELLLGERSFLEEQLAEQGMKVFPSQANYFMFKSPRPLLEALENRGILLRSCGNFHGLDKTFYRIGARTRPDNLRLIEGIKEIVNG